MSDYDERNAMMRRKFGQDGQVGEGSAQRGEGDVDGAWREQPYAETSDRRDFDPGAAGFVHVHQSTYKPTPNSGQPSIFDMATGILFQPSETFRKLGRRDFEPVTMGLIGLISANVVFGGFVQDLGLIALAIGAFTFVFVAWVIPWVTAFAVRLFGGSISDEHARIAVAWSLIPSFILFVPSAMLAVAGSDGGLLFSLMSKGVSLWSWVLGAFGLSTLGDIGLGRAFLAQIAATFILCLPIVAFVVIFVLFIIV